MTKKEQQIKILKEAILKEVKKILSESKKPKFEGLSVQDHGGVEKDDIGTFWVVMGAGKGTTTENNIFETDVFNFSEKVKSGLALENIKGIFKKEDRARRLGERFIKERQAAVSEAKAKAEKLKGLRDEVKNQVGELKKTKIETAQAVKKIDEAPSSGLSAKAKSTVVKKARAGKDIGKKGKGFAKVAKAAGGGEKGKKIAAAAMWKQQAKKK
jgi:hypothetical protein